MAKPISFEGHLEKLASGFLKNKTKIWMVLEGTSLMYFKNNKRSSCIGSIDVLEVQTVRQTGTKSGAHLEIRTGSKTFCFLAETSELAEAWVKVIHLSMTQGASLSSENRASSSQAEDQNRSSSSRTSSNIYEEINNLPSQSTTRFGVSLKKRRKPPSSPTSRSSTSTFYCEPVSEQTANKENQSKDCVSAPKEPISPPRLPVSPPELPVRSSGDKQLNTPNSTITISALNSSDKVEPSNVMVKQTSPTEQTSTPKLLFRPPPSFHPPPPPVGLPPPLVKTSTETKEDAALETDTKLGLNNPEPKTNEHLVSLPTGSNEGSMVNAVNTQSNHSSPPPSPDRKQTEIINKAAPNENQEQSVMDINSNELNKHVSIEPCTDGEDQLTAGASNGVASNMVDKQDVENVCDSISALQKQLDKDQKLEESMADNSNDNERQQVEVNIAETSNDKGNDSHDKNVNANETEVDQNQIEDKKTNIDDDDISHVVMRRSSATQRNGAGSRNTFNRGRSTTDPASINGSTQLDAQQTDKAEDSSEHDSDGNSEDATSVLANTNPNQDDINKYFSQEIINSLNVNGSNTEENGATDRDFDIGDNGMSCSAFRSLKKFLMENSDGPFDIDDHVCSTDSPMDALKAILDAEV